MFVLDIAAKKITGFHKSYKNWIRKSPEFELELNCNARLP